MSEQPVNHGDLATVHQLFPGAAAPAPTPARTITGTVVEPTPDMPAVADDLHGATPLTPAWVKTTGGWKARGKVAGINRVRSFRRWARRQKTEHGHHRQIGRGIARVHTWVRGTDGAAVIAAKKEFEKSLAAHEAASKQAKKTFQRKETRAQAEAAAKKAWQEQQIMQTAYDKVRGKGRKKRVARAASVLAPVAGIESAGLITSGMPGGLAATALTLGGLALIGRKTDAGETYNPTGDGKLGDGITPNADVLDKAFREAGILKGEQQIELRLPPALDSNAWVMPVRLKGGPNVKTVRAKLDDLASAFGVPVYQVDVIDSDTGRGDEFTLWVSTIDPFGKLFVSPLVNKPVQTDAFGRGILVGYNRRGEPVYLKLGHVLALLGGASRTGKGMLLRNLICGLALDPHVNIRLIAGAKPGEHAGYAPVCSTFFGRDPLRLIEFLEILYAEGQRREDILTDRKKAKASERDLDEFPLEVVIIDEYKQYAASNILVVDPESDDPAKPKMMKAGKRIGDLLDALAGFVAALNISILVSTQDPDANTVPRGFKSNTGARVATRTTSPTQTNAILKEGATGAGMVAHEIPKSIKGGAIVDIDGHDGDIIRSCFIEDDKYDGAEPIIQAGYELRSELGRAPGQFKDEIEELLTQTTGLTSVAGGEGGFGRPSPANGADEPAVDGILALILDAFAKYGNPEHLHTAEILNVLAVLDPDQWSYAALNVEEGNTANLGRVGGRRLGEAVSEALDGTGRTLSRVEGNGSTGSVRGRGYRLADVREAAGFAPE
ncbi:hypothetical protein ACOKM3_14175 [Streptomyces sp. BH106]|uniref:hypothetical protein n=1 Tax=Streptomyces sp. BH106 TaxID=3410409 RepID=UPI003CE77146